MSTQAPVRLRVDGSPAPPAWADRHIAVASALPRLSWTVPLVRAGQQQSASELRTSWLSDTLLATQAEPWVVLEESLEPHGVFTWSVRVQDELGEWSPWSAANTFETGPLVFADWHAQWVSVTACTTAHLVVQVPGEVTRARLHVTAQGLVRADLNGHAVNADSSDPSRTDYSRALYRSFDVTDLVGAGSNDLGLTLARGEWERTGLDPRVLAEVVIDTLDGDRIFAGTVERMTARESEVREEIPFYLERHDSTAAMGAAPAPVVLAASAAPSDPSEPPVNVLPDPSPPVRTVSVREAAACGPEVFAVGDNIAGRSRIILRSAVPRGLTVRVIHGEGLDDSGNVDTTNLTMPFDHGRDRQVVEYVTSGEVGQLLEPWFCYHGFAYLQVVGLPPTASIEVSVLPLHSDLQTVSTLTTDEPVIERLITVGRRTLLNNVHGIPEDCPTREQSGWTGDTSSSADFEFSSFDMESFFRKWLSDLRTSQQPDGSIPAIAPDLSFPRVPSDPVWGGVVHRVLLGHWMTYADRRVLSENIGMLRRWVDFQLSCIDSDSVIGLAPISYGHDWLALTQTPPRLLHTAGTLESLRALIALEVALGESSADDRREQLETLRLAAIRRFVDPATGQVANGTQASLALAIGAGWLDDIAGAGELIERDVRARGARVSSGFAATRHVVGALAATDRSQVIMDALLQPLQPGIGAMLRDGPGTLWENWWIDPANTGTGSLDHLGLGAPFAGWAEDYLAGVTVVAAGFEKFRVQPAFVRQVTRLDYERATVRGTVGVSYRRDGTQVALTVTVPVGCEAEIVLPEQRLRTVGSGLHRFDGEWAPEPELPPVDPGEWHAPSRMQESGDVAGGGAWLASAIAAGRLTSLGGALVVSEAGLRCMPVPHGQVPGPTVKVTGSEPQVRLDCAAPVDLTAATFVYAEVDTCASGPAAAVILQLDVFGADGSSVRSSGPVWPAGWNRIAADLGEWAGRSAVIAVEVSVQFDPADSVASFELGSVGVSPRRRTW